MMEPKTPELKSGTNQKGSETLDIFWFQMGKVKRQYLLDCSKAIENLRKSITDIFIEVLPTDDNGCCQNGCPPLYPGKYCTIDPEHHPMGLNKKPGPYCPGPGKYRLLAILTDHEIIVPNPPTPFLKKEGTDGT